MVIEQETDYICPSCKYKLIKIKSRYFSKQDSPVYRYLCGNCGWTVLLHESDAKYMREKGVL